MKFAVNWSPEAAELLEEDAIQFDLYKCPDWPDLVADAQSQRPAYIHFPIVIGRGQAPEWDFARIENWLTTTDTRFVNAHIIPSQPHFLPGIAIEDLAEALFGEVNALVQQFGAERVIIENCPYFSGGIADGYIPEGMEPALFQHLTSATDCGLLLDIAHSILTCELLERDWKSYIQALPVERIREMHITGTGVWSNGTRGDHLPLTDQNWAQFEWCLEQLRCGKWALPEVLAFEYGGIGKLQALCGSEKSVIASHIPRIQHLAQSIRPVDQIEGC